MMPLRSWKSGRSHWTSIAVVLRTTTWKEVGGPVGSVKQEKGGRGREKDKGGREKEKGRKRGEKRGIKGERGREEE